MNKVEMIETNEELILKFYDSGKIKRYKFKSVDDD
jgi:hypothetical protein